jgi:RNA polymerase sigma-70 factor (ECF subfamily)
MRASGKSAGIAVVAPSGAVGPELSFRVAKPRSVVRRLLELLEPEFEPATWRAFRMVVLNGKPTREAAAALTLAPNAVRIAKSRVLARFRRAIDGLLD